MAYFTHYWKGSTFESTKNDVPLGRNTGFLDHTAGEQFKSRGVQRGDTVYAITFKSGELFVVGRLIVDQILGQREAQRLLTYELWEASEHLIGDSTKLTTMRFDAVVPDAKVAAIRFLDRDGARSAPARNRRGGIDPQTFRGVRQITEPTARLFDDVLR